MKLKGSPRIPSSFADFFASSKSFVFFDDRGNKLAGFRRADRALDFIWKTDASTTWTITGIGTYSIDAFIDALNDDDNKAKQSAELDAKLDAAVESFAAVQKERIADFAAEIVADRPLTLAHDVAGFEALQSELNDAGFDSMWEAMYELDRDTLVDLQMSQQSCNGVKVAAANILASR